MVSQEASHALYIWIWIRFFLFLSFIPPNHNHPHFRTRNTDFSRHTCRMEEGVFGEIQCHIGKEPSKAILFLLMHACSVSKAAELTGTFELDTGEKWLGRQQEATVSVRAAHISATWLGLHGFSATSERDLPFHWCHLTTGIGPNEFHLFLSWCLNLLLGFDFKIMCVDICLRVCVGEGGCQQSPKGTVESPGVE